MLKTRLEEILNSPFKFSRGVLDVAQFDCERVNSHRRLFATTDL